MVLPTNEKRSQLFTLRVWPAETSEGQPEWRGKIQRVVDGETLYFHDWQAMMSFLLQALETEIPVPNEDSERRQIDG